MIMLILHFTTDQDSSLGASDKINDRYCTAWKKASNPSGVDIVYVDSDMNICRWGVACCADFQSSIHKWQTDRFPLFHFKCSKWYIFWVEFMEMSFFSMHPTYGYHARVWWEWLHPVSRFSTNAQFWNQHCKIIFFWIQWNQNGRGSFHIYFLFKIVSHCKSNWLYPHFKQYVILEPS